MPRTAQPVMLGHSNEPRAKRDSFATAVVRALSDAAVLVDGTAGQNPDVALALRRVGFAGRLVIVDWISRVLRTNQSRYLLGCANEGIASGDTSWLAASVMELDLSDAWLLLHRTLPRWMTPAGLHKPRGGDDGATMLRRLAATGAAGTIALVAQVELEAITGGASLLERPQRNEPQPRDPDDSYDWRLTSISFPTRGLRR